FPYTMLFRSKHQVRIVLLDQAYGFQTVLTLCDHVHVAGVLEQVSELVARQLFVIDQNRGKRHRIPSRAGETGRCGGDCHILTGEYNALPGLSAALEVVRTAGGETPV